MLVYGKAVRAAIALIYPSVCCKLQCTSQTIILDIQWSQIHDEIRGLERNSEFLLDVLIFVNVQVD